MANHVQWVLQNTDGQYVMDYKTVTCILREAKLYPTREAAREDSRHNEIPQRVRVSIEEVV